MEIINGKVILRKMILKRIKPVVSSKNTSASSKYLTVSLLPKKENKFSLSGNDVLLFSIKYETEQIHAIRKWKGNGDKLLDEFLIDESVFH